MRIALRSSRQASRLDVPQEIVKRWSRVYVCRDVTGPPQGGEPGGRLSRGGVGAPASPVAAGVRDQVLGNAEVAVEAVGAVDEGERPRRAM